MDTRLKQILGVNKTKESVNTDTFLNIQFNDSERLLPPDNINTVLDYHDFEILISIDTLSYML
jgi:hypothetical protein